MELPSDEGGLLVRPDGIAALMGDQYAVKSFLASYEEPSNCWIFSHVFAMPAPDAAFFHCEVPFLTVTFEVWDNQMVDLSYSKFADDDVKFDLANLPPDGQAFDPLTLIWNPCNASLARFDEIMCEHGYEQSRSKLISILTMQGGVSQGHC